jgi:glycine/D-amino acid oxidase-like deaminating enzyme
VQLFSLSQHVCGVISGPAGAIWPYRLTTGILELLLQDNPQALSLETNTLVTDITVVEDGDADHPYSIDTPRGVIRAAKVVHCTNGHVSHLVPGLRGIVVPLRGQMSAQSPGEKFHGGGEKKSWTIHYQQGFDYLVQLPVDGRASNGEMMLGGGINPATKAGIQEIGVSDDSELSAEIDVHLSGALSAVFGRENWGAVRGPSVSHMWTGIMGFSSDGHPWVGRLPSSVTGRAVTPIACNEWVAAGYSGEGMVHAWLCGKALAAMILSHGTQLHVQQEDLEDRVKMPERFLITDVRIRHASLPRRVGQPF